MSEPMLLRYLCNDFRESCVQYIAIFEKVHRLNLSKLMVENMVSQAIVSLAVVSPVPHSRCEVRNPIVVCLACGAKSFLYTLV